jgi:hypothetical protein
VLLHSSEEAGPFCQSEDDLAVLGECGGWVTVNHRSGERCHNAALPVKLEQTCPKFGEPLIKCGQLCRSFGLCPLAIATNLRLGVGYVFGPAFAD